MSDMWQVPDDLADRVRDTDYKDAWAREIEHTAQVRTILTDLIAELRERFDDESMPTFDDWTHMRRGVLADAKTAEVRLREVQGE